MRLVLRLLGWLVCITVGVIVVGLVAGFLWLRTSLPDLDGEVPLSGISGPVEILRDEYGIPTIRAGGDDDAAFGLGYVHAQDRFGQMEMMRRSGAGRMSEIMGSMTLPIDRYLRGLGLGEQAEEQAKALEPDTLRLMEAYAAGVNAWLANRSGALPWELAVLFYEPEPWRVADSLLWGRLMALRLTYNWGTEALRARMAEELPLPPERIAELWPATEGGDPASMPGLAAGGGSNVWAVSDGPVLANDPHLGLSIPSIWYLARIETPDGVLAGGTAPGIPLMALGHNGSIAWGMTTTHADTADIVRNPEVVATRTETIGVRWGDPDTLEVGETRDGVVLPSGFPYDLPEGWAQVGLLLRGGDRTPQALADMNRARDWKGFLAALGNFHSPHQNIAYADGTGRIGMIAPARLPVRPGATGFHVSDKTTWTELIPFEKMPLIVDPPAGRVVNANNRPVDDTYPHYLGREWAPPYRVRRIGELLDQGVEHARIQNDTVSLAARALLPHLLKAAPEPRLEGWDADMDRLRPEPLIYMAWVREAMRTIFADELGPTFEAWWAYRPRVLLRALTERPIWCDDVGTSDATESCADRLARARGRALDDLAERYGGDVPPWGEAHKAVFAHPIAGRIPFLRDLIGREIANGGGPQTVNAGELTFRKDAHPFRQVHGPGFRAIYDLRALDRSRFVQSVGQSGNPFSPHYDDLIPLWRDGEYVSLTAPERPSHTLRLKPQ